MLGVDAPVLQDKVPLAVVVKVEVPSQLSTTVTLGADGVVLGDALLNEADAAEVQLPLVALAA